MPLRKTAASSAAVPLPMSMRLLLRTWSLAISLQASSVTTGLLTSIVPMIHHTIRMDQSGHLKMDVIREPDRFRQAIPSAVTKATVPTMGALFARTPCLMRQPTAPIWAQIHLATSSVGLGAVSKTVRVAQAVHLLVIRMGTDAPVTAAANVIATSSA